MRESDVATQSKHVLIVDDDEMLTQLIERMLHELGCTVSVASSLPTGLAALEGERPDFVLLDVNLHGKFCYPIADRLEELEIPYSFMTAYNGVATDGPYKDSPFIRKPLAPDSIKNTLFATFGN